MLTIGIGDWQAEVRDDNGTFVLYMTSAKHDEMLVKVIGSSGDSPRLAVYAADPPIDQDSAFGMEPRIDGGMEFWCIH